MSRCLLACVAVLCGWSSLFAETAVYVVHGTYDATGDWPRSVDGKVSFGSEILRATKGRVEPFLWRTSVRHDVRVEAAKRLAKQIDADEADEVVVIGHSHGGNVALEAADWCKRKIDSVICLATPHIYLTVKGDKGGAKLLPVYCTANARKRIGTIYDFVCRGDSVVSHYADFRKGLSDQTAIEWTKQWRKTLNNPRLADDGGPVKEVFEDVFDVELTSNLVVKPDLSVADHHLELASTVSGLDAHRNIHSRRMGGLMGALIAQPKRVLPYLNSLCVQAEANPGEPIAASDHSKWVASNRDKFQFSGWLLSEVKVTSKSLRKPSGRKWDADGSRPDVAYQLSFDGERFGSLSDTKVDAETVVWRPWSHLSGNRTIHFRLKDRDFFGGHDMVGQAKFDPLSGRMVAESDHFILRTSWVKAHH